MSVPDTNTFSLQDVVNELTPVTNDLVECFNIAVDSYFDPAYKGSKDRLSNFRNYGWGATLTYRNVYKTGSNTYNDVTTYLVNKVLCVADGSAGLIYYTASGNSLTYKDNHFNSDIHYYQRVCAGGSYIYVLSSTRIMVYSIDVSDNLILENTYYSYSYDSTYSDIWYQDGKLWAVGHNYTNNKPQITVYTVGSGGTLTGLASDNFAGDTGESFNSINGDGSDYVYITSILNGVDSYHLVFSNIIRIDGDDQGDNYYDTCVNDNILLTAIGTTVGPRSHTLSSGNITYKDVQDDNIPASGIHSKKKSIFFVAAGTSGLYSYKLNTTTGIIYSSSNDDQGGIYYKCISTDYNVYVATSDGVRVYSYV